jgi:hypothetical protein
MPAHERYPKESTGREHHSAGVGGVHLLSKSYIGRPVPYEVGGEGEKEETMFQAEGWRHTSSGAGAATAWETRS